MLYAEVWGNDSIYDPEVDQFNVEGDVVQASVTPSFLLTDALTWFRPYFFLGLHAQWQSLESSGYLINAAI